MTQLDSQIIPNFLVTMLQDGNTLLHGLAEFGGLPTPVYILAEHGILINHLNTVSTYVWVTILSGHCSTNVVAPP